MLLRPILLAGALLAGCTGDEAPPPPPSQPEVAPPKPAEPTLNPADLGNADSDGLVPSPKEMQEVLTRAGLASRLETMVQDRDIKMDVENQDQIAVRVGVVLADLVLTLKTAPKERTVARLGALQQGLAKLGAGPDIDQTINGLKDGINSGALTGDKLVHDIDELSLVMVPELNFEGKDWVVPLIQAGSWLEGAHLVSGAMKAEAKLGAADQLLKQPQVVDFFIKYVDQVGTQKAPDDVVKKLKETLSTLKEVAAKPTLGQAEVDTIHSSTGAVLSML